MFDIDLVEDAVGWGLDELPEAEEKKKKSKGEPGLPHSVGGLMASLDAIELLAALQLTEQQKLQLIEKLKAFLIVLFQVIDIEGAKRNNDIHRKMVLAMANEGADFPWDERFTKFKSLLDTTATSLKILTHPDRKALLLPLLKRPELMMADYEDVYKRQITDTVQKLKPGDELRPPSSDEIYQNPDRQSMVAKQAALVFVAKTMMAIRPPGRTLGEGKAMFAAHSIRAAIAYQPLLRAELDLSLIHI